MRCYYHSETNGVGVCRGCGKALCRRCTRDTGFGLTCSEACTERARQHEQLVTFNRRLHGLDRRSATLNAPAVMYTVFALILWGLGVYTSITRGLDYLTLLVAAGFTVMAVLAYRRSKEFLPMC